MNGSTADKSAPQNGVRGLEAYASTWPPFFHRVQQGARFHIDELHVEAADEIAFAWALLRCGTDCDLKSDPDRRLRLPFGLRRQAGSCTILYEHHSFTHQ